MTPGPEPIPAHRLADARPHPQPAYLVGSVDRALRILLLLRSERAVTLTAVSRALDVAPSTAHRLLTTLVHHDFVRQDPATRAYVPGRALLEIGLAAAGSLDIRRLARPELESLTRALEETVHLALRDGARVIFLDTVESPRAVRVTDRTGMTLPAHCTAAGKALLAELASDDLRATLGREPFEQVMPRTCTTLAQLAPQLRQIRTTGYATNFAESERGLSAVAAAIPDPHGVSTMSVSVSVPSERIDDARVRQIGAAAILAAERIGKLAAGF
jgi:DNA-binding IclR family transcriptional regulator